MKVYIPQLSFLDLRKARREAMKLVDKSETGKKILMALDSSIPDDEEIGEISDWDRKMFWDELLDHEDLWLAFLALKEVKHPKITGDFNEDRNWIEFTPDIQDFIYRIKFFNGLETERNPSGVDAVKSFRRDGLLEGTEDRT